MILGSTYPLTEMDISNFCEGKVRPTRKADNFTTICDPIVCKIWELFCVTNLWDSTVCYGAGFIITNNSEDVITAFDTAVVLSLTFRRV
jgi:hypothetical protein